MFVFRLLNEIVNFAEYLTLILQI